MTEDFTDGDWSEFDPESSLVRTTSRVTWTDLYREEEGFIFKSFGSSAMPYVYIDFDLNVTTIDKSATESRIHAFTVADTHLSWETNLAANNDQFGVLISNPNTSNEYKLTIRETDSGSEYSSSASDSLDINITYYCRFTRFGEQAELSIYSDDARLTLIETVNHVFNTVHTVEFFMLPHSLKEAGVNSYKSSGYLENLDIISIPSYGDDILLKTYEEDITMMTHEKAVTLRLAET